MAEKRFKNHFRLPSDSNLLSVPESKNANSECLKNFDNGGRRLIVLLTPKIPYVKLIRLDIGTLESGNAVRDYKRVTCFPLSEAPTSESEKAKVNPVKLGSKEQECETKKKNCVRDLNFETAIFLPKNELEKVEIEKSRRKVLVTVAGNTDCKIDSNFNDCDMEFKNAVCQKNKSKIKDALEKIKMDRFIRKMIGNANAKIALDNIFKAGDLKFKNAVFQRLKNEDNDEVENVEIQRTKRCVRRGDGDTEIIADSNFEHSDLDFQEAINDNPKYEYSYEPENLEMPKRKRGRKVSRDSSDIVSDLNSKKASYLKSDNENKNESGSVKKERSNRRQGKTVPGGTYAKTTVNNDFNFDNVDFQKAKIEDIEPKNIKTKGFKRRRGKSASTVVNITLEGQANEVLGEKTIKSVECDKIEGKFDDGQAVGQANEIKGEETARSMACDAIEARPIGKSLSQAEGPVKAKPKSAKKRLSVKCNKEPANSEVLTNQEKSKKESFSESEKDEPISNIPTEKFKHNIFQKYFDSQIGPYENSSEEQSFDSKFGQGESPKLRKPSRKRNSKRKVDWETKMKTVKLNGPKSLFLDKNHADSDCSPLTRNPSDNSYSFRANLLSESELEKTLSPGPTRKDILNDLSGIIKSYSSPKYDCSEEHVYKLLSSSCFKRLRHVVQAASKNQLSNGHGMLTVNDFQKGLLLCNEEPVSNAYVQKKRKGRQSRINLPQPLHGRKHQPLSVFPVVTEFWIEKEDPMDKDTSEVPDDLKAYFQLVSSALEKGGEPCTLALDDLKCNKNILVLVPNFVSLISSEILSNIGDFTKLSVAIDAVASLFSNPFLHLEESHFTTFAYLLLKCLLSPLHSFQGDQDFQLLKDKAAELLNQVLKRSCSKKLWFELLFLLEAAFCDEEKSLVTHYGVLKAINSMGVFAVMIAVVPHVDRFIKYLDSASKEKTRVYQAVRGQLLQSSHLIVQYMNHKDSNECHYSENFVTDEQKQIPIHCLRTLSDYFGDGFDLLIPSLSYVYTPNRIKKIILPMYKYYLKAKLHLKNEAPNLGKKSVSDSCQRNIAFDLVPLKKHSIMFK